MFVGQYYMGDVTYKGLQSVNNAHGMYWKRSKNFADKQSYHIENSVFLTASGKTNSLKYKSFI